MITSRKRSTKSLPIKKVIAVDVDETLIINGQINQGLIDWCISMKAAGYILMLWSARGQTHAERAASYTETETLFDHIISKPGYIVDDKGWNWIKDTKVINPIQNGMCL